MDTLTVFILCGGKSFRMKSEKGLVLFQNKPFISHVIDAVLPITKNIVLVTNSNEYDYLPYLKINDIAIDKGPLGGIYTALHYSKTEQNLILSCDIPLITTALLEDFIAKYDENVLVTVLASESKMHPLIGIYSKRMEDLIKNSIEKNELKLRDFIVGLPHQIIRYDENESYQLLNINTPDELEKLINNFS